MYRLDELKLNHDEHQAVASIVIEAMESLGAIWAVELSVLGIYVYKRSKEKEISSKFYK